MKSKILKMVTIMLLLATLTMTNFIYVGAGLVSYAASNLKTSNSNIEFDAYLKDHNTLFLEVNVKREGYFNGEITLENSNFTLKNSESTYINKIEGNTITLNQLNAGTSAQIEIGIEPIKNDVFDIGLLNMVSKLNLNGIYKDSTEKNITVKASREVELKYEEENKEENVESTMQVITNKIVKVSGEEKRVVQIAMNMGLKENNYPIQEINSKIVVPTIDGKNPIIAKKVNLNTMTNYEVQSKDDDIEVTFTNEPNEENKILWKKQGNERVVFTLIYDREANIEQSEIQAEEKITLYNEKEINVSNKLVLDLEEKDALVQLNAINTENSIYKGKLYSGIERQYESRTTLAINLANAEEGLTIKEMPTTYTVSDKEVEANIEYQRTTIKKDAFDKIFGQSGEITITNQQNEIVAVINNLTPVDENGNIVIDYTGKDVKSIEIKTTTPIAEGDIELIHIKVIKAQEKEIIKEATKLNTKVISEYNNDAINTVISETKLEESKTEAKLEVNKDTLSTVVENTVEMRAILKGNNEQYNLYKNPSITFELPAEVQEIKVNSIDLLYETELKVKGYKIEKNKITVQLEGEQTSYKEEGLEGTLIVLNANLVVNKKAASKDTRIVMTYNNEGITGAEEKVIRIVAPKDVTTIHSIKELGIETIGQEDIKTVTLQRGKDKKVLENEIEVINNNENSIENTKIMGTFATKGTENNIDIKVTEGITLEGVEGVKVYYTEKEDATEDIQNSDNAWTEGIIDSSKVRKYLIEVPIMDAQTSVKATYKTEVPDLLEYNQKAKQGYEITYTNSATKLSGKMKATTLSLETGIGPKAEVKLVPTIGGSELTENTTVKNGEVIQYRVQISNTGSEDLKDITISGNVPEGTTLVKPQDNYEYTGASYYKEFEDRKYEEKIDLLKVGEVITKQYEVRVNADVPAGTKIVSTTELKYGDVIKKSEESQITTSKGDIRVSVKRVTDRKIDLYETGTVQYFAIIENISGQKQDNVTVKTILPEALEVTELTLIKGMKSEEISDGDIYDTSTGEEEISSVSEDKNDVYADIEEEVLEYKEEVNIGTLEANEVKVLSYEMTIKKLNDTKQINFAVSVKDGDENYKSNEITDNVKKAEITLSMISNTDSKYVKSGDIIEYIITVKNNGVDNIEGIVIKDIIPNSLTVDRVSLNEEEIVELKDNNNIQISCNSEAKSEKVIKIKTIVNYLEGRVEPEQITNIAQAEFLGETIATTSEINHIIEAEESNSGNGSAGNNNDENNVDNNDIANGSKMITGIAWFDENANGQKDDSEKTLSNIKVHLLNTKTNHLVKDENGKVIEASTNDKGLYVLNNIGNGSYIVIFEYDNTKYSLTKYKATNVEEAKNSNAMMNELLIDDTKQQVASTDMIEINNNNISDINIGFIKLENFDLKLEKFVNRILIQNAAGTTVKEYNDATMAKVELDAKKINGTTVIVEYKIRVINVGEVAGYAKKIADYAPNDMKFSSELNKDWYQTGDTLYSTSLANDKIAAGESREIILTLTKTMTEDNTGRTNNTAEIAESYNDLGIADSNSIPGNKKQGENDMGAADVILSIRTGGVIYIGIVIAIVAVLGVTAVVVIKKKNKKPEEKI